MVAMHSLLHRNMAEFPRGMPRRWGSQAMARRYHGLLDDFGVNER